MCIVKKAPMEGTSINDTTLLLYLRQKLGSNNVQITKDVSYKDEHALCLLQKDYGEDNDCTLTSITAFCNEILEKDNDEVYKMVEKIARRYGYTGDKGTNPLFVRSIINRVFEEYWSGDRAGSMYIKNLGFDYCKLCQMLDEKHFPMIFNIFRDGRNCYDDHTILLIGYKILAVHDVEHNKDHTVRLLQVYDNWHPKVCYVDYEYLCICSLNYLRT